MPAIGYGTCCRKTAKGEPLIRSTEIYLANGGRLIDTAQMYGNHRDLAVAIRESGVPREELWVTSKVNVRKVSSADEVTAAVDQSRRELGVGYLDLMLLHGGDGWGITAEDDVKFWEGLLAAKREGMVRAVGVSNHNREEIERLLALTGELPAVNQLEFHPWVPAETKSLVRWCLDQGIAVTAYGSLGGSSNKAQGDAVAEVARARGATNAQVLLRWALDQGVAIIPGATSQEHIKENLQAGAVQLEPDDERQLEGADKPSAFRRWRNCKAGCA